MANCFCPWNGAFCSRFLVALQKLEQLLPFVIAYIKSSFQLKGKLKDLDCLPTNARMVIADARSIYTRIETKISL